ncbi:hypothetical protein [Methylobacter sp.]|uniref:hypothetical protein n=1 Tax=Methylobacter sp. TaxID=2051955 RepID=UPI002FDE5217
MTTVTSNLNDQNKPTYCANPGCHCEVQEGEKYCSASCENQLDGNLCSCEHANCQAAQKELT